MYSHIIDGNGDVILSDLPEEYLFRINNCKSENSLVKFNSRNWREGISVNRIGTIYLLAYDSDLIKSSRLFNEKMRVLKDFIGNISKIRDSIIKDLLHNLTAIHGHNIQEVHYLIPEYLMLNDIRKQKEKIKEIIVGNLDDTASALIKIIRNNKIMNAEFQNIRVLHGEVPVLEFSKHPIHKVIQSLIYLYLPDFQEKEIRINNNLNSDVIRLDHSTFTDGMIPILENCIKYTKNKTILSFDYYWEDDVFIIKLCMESLRILPNEIKRITDKKFSGSVARSLKRHGSGLGMYHSKKLLELNKIIIDISSNGNEGDIYGKNTFYLKFLKP
jgi:K+-sensing histidine kinase KdpD